MTRVPHHHLRKLCASIQTDGYGVPETDAATVADCLVEANLMGLDTHGIIRLKFYMDRVKAGGNNPRPNITVVRQTAFSALLDADNALGPVGGARAMELAIEKASAAGIGLVLIRRCNHYGPAGHYVRLAVAKGLIGISLTNVLGCMPPTGGAQKLFGNNAYAIGFPASEELPVIVDAATSKSSWGKLMVCAQNDEPLPEGCFVDSNGRATLNPKAVMEGGALLPFADHKGYGISVAIALLTGMLADATLDHEIRHPYKELSEPGENTFLMGAMRIDSFSDPERFRRRMDEWVRLVRTSKPADGADRVWLPGEQELATRQERIQNGIPLNSAMMGELEELAKAAGAKCSLA
jgi:LDH2 family malate/lactate/ureidoglycolate dehydrogenase